MGELVRVFYKNLMSHDEWLPTEGYDYLPGEFSTSPIGYVPPLQLPLKELQKMVEFFKVRLGHTWWVGYIEKNEYSRQCEVCAESRKQYFQARH